MYFLDQATLEIKESFFHFYIQVTEFSQSLGLKFQDLGCQDQVLALFLTRFSNKEQSWVCPRLKFCFKISLDLNLV